MILLALAKTERKRGHSSINTQRTAISFIRLLPLTTLLPRGETLLPTALILILRTPLHFSSTSKPANHQHLKLFKEFFACKVVLVANHQHPKKIKDFFACKVGLVANHQHLKIFKGFFDCKVVLVANHQHPKTFKGFFDCKIVLAANHKYLGNIQRLSGQQQQPAAATSSSNQQQQPAAAISSSDQQQQPTVVINSSNQQRDRHQQSACIPPAAPTINADLR